MRTALLSFLSFLSFLFPLFAFGCARSDPAATEPDDDSLERAIGAATAAPSITTELGMSYVALLPGPFVAGSPDDEPGHDETELLREAAVVRPIYMSVHEVTQQHWEHVMGSNPSRFVGANRPVDSVSLLDVLEFIEKLSVMDPTHIYRLPTPDEWEYACRAGTTTPYSTGLSLRPDQANVRDIPADGAGQNDPHQDGTTRAGAFDPNPWGLHDMHGNLWEWTSDGNLRGGAWNFSGGAARCAARLALGPGTSYDVNGFRLVREVLPRQ